MNFDPKIFAEFFAKTRNFSGNTGGDVGLKGQHRAIENRKSRIEIQNS